MPLIVGGLNLEPDTLYFPVRYRMYTATTRDPVVLWVRQNKQSCAEIEGPGHDMSPERTHEDTRSSDVLGLSVT